jgi:2-polyprenyl-3-methyl-5-hydroxy-6-metoxy-1,4-benzoquinol methylase
MDMSGLAVTNDCARDACPLCAARDLASLGRLSYAAPILFSTNPVTMSHEPELWQCGRCRSRFVQNTVDAETAKLLYSTGQAGDRWSSAPFEQNKTREVIAHMKAIFENKGRVLDVGCNTGELLDFARGLGCRTAGVEFSAASRDTLRAKGHGAYASLAEAPGEYDAITAFDLVEHLYDVPGFLKSCREKLSPQGRLVILTGNIGSLSARMAGARWWYARYPEHIVFPSKKYFRESSGLRIDKWIVTYASRGYRYPIRQVLWELRNSVRRRHAHTGLPSIGPDHVLAVLKK